MNEGYKHGMAVTRDPAQEDFLRYLGTKNPYKDIFTGMYPTYGSVVSGTNWRNSQVAGRNSLTAPLASASPSSKYSLLSLSKDPASDSLLDSALANLGRRSTGSALTLGKYNTALDRSVGDSERDIIQEEGSVNDVFSGRLGTSLRDATAAYRTSTDTTNAADDAALKAIRDKYGIDQSSAIKLLYSNLGRQRGDYETRVTGDIGNEVARRNADARNFAVAARRSTDQSIADATRENKAQFGQEGGGGSSYAQRLGMGQRVRANTALTQALAELRMGNTEKELGRRGELTNQLGSLERGDIAGEGQAGLNLGTDLNQQDYRNYAATLGRRQQIEDTVGNRDLAAIQYEQAQKAGLLGARSGLRRSSLADILGGVSANQNFDANELRNLGLAGEIRRANRFLGIDDGSGDFLPTPRIPNFSRPYREPVPQYPDNPYFSPQGGGNPSGGNPSGQGNGGALPGESALQTVLRTGRWPYDNQNLDGTLKVQPQWVDPNHTAYDDSLYDEPDY